MISGRSQSRQAHPKRLIALAVLLAVVLACAAGFAVYVNTYYHGEPAAVQAMASDSTVSVYELRDGVLDMGKYEQYHSNLPTGTSEVVIDGGCHAGFGRYGAQDGDGTPTISSDEQIDRTAQEIARMMGLLTQ